MCELLLPRHSGDRSNFNWLSLCLQCRRPKANSWNAEFPNLGPGETCLPKGKNT